MLCFKAHNLASSMHSADTSLTQLRFQVSGNSAPHKWPVCKRKTSDKWSKVYSLTFILLASYVYFEMEKRKNSQRKRTNRLHLSKQFSKNKDCQKSESERSFSIRIWCLFAMRISRVFYSFLWAHFSMLGWVGLVHVHMKIVSFSNWTTNHSKRCFLTYQCCT